MIKIDRKKKNSVSCGGDSVRIDVEESTNKGAMRTPGKAYIQEFTGCPTNLLEFDRVPFVCVHLAFVPSIVVEKI